VSGVVHIGCSGWSYPHWRGVVYPEDLPAKRWFSHYAKLFSTVELNSTFYRLPAATTFVSWRAQAPENFVYAVKLNRYGTHRRKLLSPESWLPDYVARVRELGPSLGPNLVQLPPHWKRDVGRLRAFFEIAAGSAPRGEGLRWAVEFRDPSWLDESTYEVLRNHEVALCCHDMLPEHPWLLTTDWTYLRFHGPAGRQKYTGEYGPHRLVATAERLLRWQQELRELYVYFNNDVGGAAVRDASWLCRRLSAQGR
jgi:uncharacterized protein YecE (DUF72 family)